MPLSRKNRRLYNTTCPSVIDHDILVCLFWFGPFQKLQIKIFQAAFISEIVISGYFWLVIWNWKVDKFVGGFDPSKDIGACLQHIIPLWLLTIDYCLFNAYPFMKRQILPTFLVFLTYMIVNFTYCKLHYRIYPKWTWDSWQGSWRPLCILGLSFVVNLAIV